MSKTSTLLLGEVQTISNNFKEGGGRHGNDGAIVAWKTVTVTVGE